MGHIHAGNALDLGHTIVGGTDIVAEARENFATEFSAATYETPDALIDNEDLDGVVVTVPNKFHADAVEAALADDLCVLCEKPLAHTVSSAESISEAVASSDGWVMLGLHNRFAPGVQTAVAHRDAGTLGRVQHVRAQYIRKSGVPRPGSWFTNKDLAGGGALIDIGVHTLDIALYALGFPEVKTISATTRELTDADCEEGGWGVGWGASDGDTIDVERAATAFIECEGGKTILLDVSWASNQEPTQEIIARGTNGGVRFDLGGDVCDLIGIDEDAAPDPETPLRPSTDQHRREVEAFTDAIATDADAPLTSGISEALTVQRVLGAIYDASDSTVAISRDESGFSKVSL